MCTITTNSILLQHELSLSKSALNADFVAMKFYESIATIKKMGT